MDNNFIPIDANTAPVTSQRQQVSTNAAAEVGILFAGPKACCFVSSNHFIARLHQGSGRKKHPLGSSEFFPRPAAEIHLLQHQVNLFRRKGFAKFGGEPDQRRRIGSQLVRDKFEIRLRRGACQPQGRFG